MKKQSGFTLIEMMTAIGILGILAAVAIPGYISWLPQIRLSGATHQIVGDLMNARMLAVKESKDVTISTGASSYTVTPQSETPVTKSISNSYPGVSMSTSSITFNARGVVSGTLPTITVNGGSAGTKSISVSITGRVKVS